jgi:hypothetical protein
VTACVFAGPTLAPAKVRAAGDFVCLPPVAQGDVYRAVQAGARAIGIIDGYFEGVPAVWHKEILWAIAQGVPVFGSASMGALRGAELCAFGMRGVGRIFEGYRNGSLEDDDDVAVLHGPAETGYVALSEPMVNVRATLENAVAGKVIPTATGQTLAALAKGLFYQERTWEALFSKAVSTGLPGHEITALRGWLPGGRVDLKAEDAVAMLTAMADWQSGEQEPGEVNFDFEWTDMWDTAIAVSRTVGLDPTGETGAVSPDRLLDELRIDGDAYRTAKTAALARLLGLREADRRRLTIGRGAVGNVIDRLRTSLGLYRRAELDQWLEANDLAAEDFERLMEEGAQLDACSALVEPALDKPILDNLRLSGGYPRLAERARRKHAVLAGLGHADPEPADIGLTPPQLVRWYFSELLGEAAPDDLDTYIGTLGIAGRPEFYRLLTRERLFLSNEEPVAEDL